MRNLFSVFSFIFISIIISGCLLSRDRFNLRAAEKRVNFYTDIQARETVQRIMVMPVVNSSQQENIESSVYTEFILKLSSYNYFEIIRSSEISSGLITRLAEIHQQKNFSSDKNIFKELSDAGIQAVLFPEVTFYRAYKPLLFGCRLVMVSTIDESVIWSVDDVFDMSRQNIIMLSKNWYYRNHDSSMNPSLGGEIMEISMDNFVRFSFELICETWTKEA